MEIFTNMTKQLRQIRIRQMPKIPPISSTMAEKIKSFFTTGILEGEPWNRPIPNHPPVPMANSDWAT